MFHICLALSMSTFTKASPTLKLVIVGQGETRGRRPHLVRLRESLVQELKTYVDGQFYLVIELALQRLIDDLKQKEGGVEVIQVAEMSPDKADEHLMDQYEAQKQKRNSKKAVVAKKQQKTS
jgi:hypothetical protein